MNRTHLSIAGAVLLAALVGAAGGRWLVPAAPPADDSSADEREVLYWVAPMDPDYRRDEPGKSPMGMDLVPVYADGGRAKDAGEPSLEIAPAVVNNIGVKTAPARRGTLHRRIETVGFVMPDEDRLEHVHVRAEGWIEELAVDTGGARVEAGDLLFRIYSPALVSAQEEYLQSQRSGRPALLRAGATRLRALGMREDQIEALADRGQAHELFEVRAPIGGYLMELNVRQGMFVEPGTVIMSIADLSRVWVEVDLFAQQAQWVEAGQSARMTLPYAQDRVWDGTVDYLYPTIRAASRTARARLAFANPDLALKPNMYVELALAAAPRRGVVHVPREAVIRTGSGERVILALGDGRFRPAQVRTGLESEGRVEIIDGLAAGERVVVSSQFLIDSEASMDASLLRLLDPGDGSADGEEAGNGEPPEPARETMDHTGHAMGAGGQGHGGNHDAGGGGPPGAAGDAP